MATTLHAPLPWHIDRNSDGYLWITDSNNSIGIARLSNPQDYPDYGNAALICRAVNSFSLVGELVNTLYSIQNVAVNGATSPHNMKQIAEMAQEAITRARAALKGDAK